MIDVSSQPRVFEVQTSVALAPSERPNLKVSIICAGLRRRARPGFLPGLGELDGRQSAAHLRPSTWPRRAAKASKQTTRDESVMTEAARAPRWLGLRFRRSANQLAAG